MVLVRPVRRECAVCRIPFDLGSAGGARTPGVSELPRLLFESWSNRCGGRSQPRQRRPARDAADSFPSHRGRRPTSGRTRRPSVAAGRHFWACYRAGYLVTMSEGLGMMATGLVIAGYVPQIGHLIKERCTAGISVPAFLVWCVASTLFLVHAALIDDSVFASSIRSGRRSLAAVLRMGASTTRRLGFMFSLGC